MGAFLGLAAFGLLIGAMTGLSVSPVVSTVVSTLVGIMIAVPFRANPNSHGSNQLITSRLALLLPFSLFALIGSLGGLALRTNDVLSPSIKTQAAKWTNAGFPPDLVEIVVLNQRTGLIPEGWTKEASDPTWPSVFYMNRSRNDSPKDPTDTDYESAKVEWSNRGEPWSTIAVAVGQLDTDEKERVKCLSQIRQAILQARKAP